MDGAVRLPAVAGTFYPGSQTRLERELDDLMPRAVAEHELLACVAPHAGYMYSGGVAGVLYTHLRLPRRIIILGPNHTGAGGAIAVAPHRTWSTPLGETAVDDELRERFLAAVPGASLDAGAHRREHSIEVQVPFLARRVDGLRILPICLKHLGGDDCLALGELIADLVAGVDDEVGIVASSDMTHFRPDELARRQDRLAIDAMVERDPVGLYTVVHREGISMCGVIPATVAIAAANRLGAAGAHLVDYATSGDVTGDRSNVVGYAGVCIHR